MSSPKRRKKVTQKDIAKKTGLSTRTVSLALGRDPTISEDTMRRVQEAARELNYIPKTEQSSALGLIVPDLNHLPYVELICRVREAAFAQDVVTLVGDSTGNREVERRLTAELIQRGVGGLVLVSPRMLHKEVQSISISRRPIVTVNLPVGENSALQFGSVEIDNEQGSYAAVRYLAERGCSKIVYFHGRPVSASALQRKRGYLRALEGLGRKQQDVIIPIGDYRPNYRAGYDLCRQMLADQILPDAILAYNDLMAVGILKALQEQGIRVPEQVSVIGFDNVVISHFMHPSLTTVSVQHETVAHLTIDTLMGMIAATDNSPAPKLHHKLVPQLIPGASTKP